MQDIHRKAQKVCLAVFDVDGVLTDGALYYSDSGAEIKAFHVRDGQGLKMLQESGVRTAIVTSRRSNAVTLRARDLGIELCFQGVADKLQSCRALLAELALEPQAMAYIGDDLVDLPVMALCGLAATVPGAPVAVRRWAHYVTEARGGHGAAREFCELIMHARGTLEAQVTRYTDVIPGGTPRA